MWKTIIVAGVCLGISLANPLGLKRNMAIVQEDQPIDEVSKPEMVISKLNLPSNATSIRADITDGFTCENKTYGYYADVENDCQIFHVCLPVTYADGKENTFRWSFICPEETVFSQDSFTCMRSEDMSIECEESFKYYELNRNFGMATEETMDEQPINHNNDNELEDAQKQPDVTSLNAEKEQKVTQSTMVSLAEKKDQKKENVVKGQTTNKRKTPSKVNTSNNKKKIQPIRKASIASATTIRPIIEDNIESESQIVRKKFQPIRKIPVPTVASTTTIRSNEIETVEDDEKAATTTVKYQKFTRRPDINKDQKKPEMNTINKRKRPEIQIQPEIQTTTESISLEKNKPESIEKTQNQELPTMEKPLNQISEKKPEQKLTEKPLALAKPQIELAAEKPDNKIKVEIKPDPSKEDANEIADATKIEMPKPMEVIESPEPIKNDNNSMITDFIASLINNENGQLDEELKNDEMMLKAEKAAEAMAQENQQILTIDGNTDDNKQIEPIDLVFEDNVTPAIEAVKTQNKNDEIVPIPIKMDKTENAVEVPSAELQGISKPVNSEKIPTHSFDTSNMSEMLHIPVRIVHDEDPTIMTVPMTNNKEPIKELPHSFSIDDIVELVKESVDSANEKQKLAAATATATANDKEKINVMPQSGEILPIYNRIPSPANSGLVKPGELSTLIAEPLIQDDVMIKIPIEKTETSGNVQNSNAESEKPITPNTVAVKKLKTVPLVGNKKSKRTTTATATRKNNGRSLSTKSNNSMNPRKRQFMFRADATS